ncbi:methyl-accepting chemotaxis protein [Clostridium sp. DL1XJH146]
MKIKIRTKQLINFALISILTATIGLIGIINMNNGNNNVKEIYEDRLIPIQNLSTLQNNLSHIQNTYSYILYDKRFNGFNKQIDTINELKNENSTLIDTLNNYNLTEDETLILNSILGSLEDYNSTSEIMGKYLEADNYDAALLVAPDLNWKKTSVDTSINNFIEENNLQAKLLTENMQNSFDTTLTAMIIFVIIAILFSIVSNLIISKSINNPIKEILTSANLVADGNLDVHINMNTDDEMNELANAFNKMAENTNTTVSKINSISNEVATEARQVYDSSASLSQGASEQASSIEQLKASIEEIASQTRHNAENAKMAKSITDRAKINAVNGNAHMDHMLAAMTKINDSSNNISTIIKVIDEIAFQTNILALNAAIEAARAGEHGKGFAVVADEVKNLANRSSAAAKETTALIEESINKVEDGTNLANITSEALQKIVDDIESAATLISDISIASNEQSVGVEQINQGVALIGNVVQTISATSEQTSSLSETLSNQAEMLKEQVNKFKLKSNDTDLVNDTLEELNPEVLEILDNMESKNKEVLEEQNDNKELYENSIYSNDNDDIIINDTDFGKY